MSAKQINKKKLTVAKIRNVIRKNKNSLISLIMYKSQQTNIGITTVTIMNYSLFSNRVRILLKNSGVTPI